MAVSVMGWFRPGDQRINKIQSLDAHQCHAKMRKSFTDLRLPGVCPTYGKNTDSHRPGDDAYPCLLSPDPAGREGFRGRKAELGVLPDRSGETGDPIGPPAPLQRLFGALV